MRDQGTKKVISILRISPYFPKYIPSGPLLSLINMELIFFTFHQILGKGVLVSYWLKNAVDVLM